MGANFINSILEKAAEVLRESINPEQRDRLDIVMAILSNYTPESRIEMKLECPVDELNDAEKTMSGQQFAEKFCQAVEIARQNISRAVTHNKGIMNGIDAVVIATGNDFRAIEAGVHAFAAQSGQYTSLTNCSIHEGIFTYQLSIPLALGTVGGLTKLHPLAEQSMKILGNPSAEELMKIVAAAGLANNFGAVRSLITSGIQKGHMKLHLNNILLTLNVDQQTKEKAKAYFKDKPVSFTEVKAYVEKISK
jgi:hydroxymethylglutaryl-CoA reductase